jgi:hypothetical protein
MTTKTLEKEVFKLKREVRLLRSAVIGIVGERDPEGEYKPEFVRSVLKAIVEPAPYTFTNSRDFLKRLRKK